jgi:hypothetical protein
VGGRHRAGHGLVTLLVLGSLVLAACGGDDDATGESGTPTTARAATTGGSGSATTGAATATSGATATSAQTVPSAIGALDLVALTFLGQAPGEPAQPVLDAAIAALGAPERDTGWGPTECPVFERARAVDWGPLRLDLRAVDGTDTFTGAYYNTAFEGADGDRELVRLPPGVEWGQPMQAVATAVGGQVEEDPVLQWESVLLEGAALSGDASAGPAVLGWAEIGEVPKCR